MAWVKTTANFRGPKGDKGDPGERGADGAPGKDGAALTNKGVVTEASAFNAGDVFQYRGFRVAATKALSGISGTNPWVSAANYTITGGDGAVFSAYDFGVRATGNDADAEANSVALQRAVEYVAAQGGGTLQLQSGNIRFKGNLALKQGVVLRGAGVLATVLQAAAGANYDFLVGNEVATNASGKNHMWCGVRDIMLDGRRANQTAGTGHGVRLVTNPRVTKAAGDTWFDPHHILHNVWVYMCRGDGYHFDGRSALQAQSLFASQCDGWGLRSTFDTNLSHIESDSCKLGGFLFPSGSIRAVNLKAFLSGSGVAGPPAPGFHLTNNAYAVNLASCEAQNNTGPGFLIEGSRGCTLVACGAESNWKDPTKDGPGPAGAGFVVRESVNCTIVGSSTQGTQNGVLIGNQQNAVLIDSSSTGCTIMVTHTGIYGAAIGDPVTGAVDLSANSVIANGRVAVGGASEAPDPALPKGWSPADRGLVGWSFDPTAMTSAEGAQVGRLYFARTKATVQKPISALGVNVKTSAPEGATAEMGLYDPSTKRLLASGQLDVTRAGLRFAELSGSVPVASLGQEFIVTLLVTAAASAPVIGKSATNVGDLNIGLDAQTYVLGQAGNGLSSTPSELGTLSWSGGMAMWAVLK